MIFNQWYLQKIIVQNIYYNCNIYKYIHVCHLEMVLYINIIIDIKLLNHIKIIKCICIILESDLSWKYHFNYLKKKSLNILSIIKIFLSSWINLHL